MKDTNNQTVLETLQYTANGGRDASLNACGNIVSESYYSTDWQVLERIDTSYPPCGGPTTSTSTYVWGLSYVNDLVARDTDGTRTYVQQDANHNVTAREREAKME